MSACTLPLADPAIIADVERLAALRATALLDSPIEATFDRWTELAAQLIGVPTTLISLVDDHRQFFKSSVGLPEPWASRRETPLSHSFCQHAVASGYMLAVEDAREHPLVNDNLAVTEMGVIAYAGAPLKDAEGQTLGVLCAIDGVPRRWTAQELATLEALSKSVMNEIQLRTTIQRLAKSESESRRQAVLVRTIVDHLGAAVSATDMHDGVLLQNDMARRYRDAHTRGELRLYDENNQLVVWNQRPLARAVRGERLHDIKLREEEAGRDPSWLRISAHPLLDEHGVQFGAVSEARDITAMHLAQEELRSLNERLREQSFADELTGLYNRRGFLTLSTQELKVMLRSRRTAVVFYIDLDGMKAINDKLGHEIGDAALLESASILRATFRDSDIPARMGGDEFAIFAVEANESNAQMLADRLQRNVAEANREADRKFRIAMSCGFSLFDPFHPETLATLITRADEAMYADKQRRRAAR